MIDVPPSLKVLCFAHVSDLIGSRPGRDKRVKKLQLPKLLQKSLMFECSDQRIACNECSAIDDMRSSNQIQGRRVPDSPTCSLPEIFHER